MTRIRILFAEALRSIGANVSTTVASALSVLIGMFLIGVFIGLGTWLVSWSDDKKRELAVHVFIADAATTKQINELRVLLESDERVKPGGITFISKERALEIMRKRNPELTANLASNPLPASFDVVPKRGEDTEAIALAVQKLEARRPSTRCATARRSRSGSSQIARAHPDRLPDRRVILLAASTILIANTIRLSIFARRREIEVMKLVGATNWYVRGPFMLEGVLTGLVGSRRGGAAALRRPRDRDPADPRPHPGRPRRAGARVHVDGRDPDHGRPRDRRARLGPDAPPLPARLAPVQRGWNAARPS